jgi:hypothetical protein
MSAVQYRFPKPRELFTVVSISRSSSAGEMTRVTIPGIVQAWEHAAAVSWVGGTSYLQSSTELMIFQEGRPVEWSRGPAL